MLDTFFRGASYPFQGLRWLSRPQVRRFVIVPLLVNIILFSVVMVWGISEFGALIDSLLARLPEWLDWLRWLLWPLFAITTLVVFFYTFTLVANLIASPFNSLLAERVEDLASPGQVRPQGAPLWKEIVLSPLAELKKLVYFLIRAVPLLVLFFIPGINVAAPLLWVAFTAWMLALQYVDYPMGNHLFPFRDQRRILGERRLLALGFGAAVLLITLVPVLNFLAMPASVIGATLMWVEQFPELKRSIPMTAADAAAPLPPSGSPGN
jgi:CysZ protein